MTWMTVAVLAVGTIAIRSAGLWFGGRPGGLGSPHIARAIDLVPAAMLAALVAVQTFGSPGALTLDARVAGVAAAAVVVAARLPFFAAIIAAAAVAALVRAIGLA